jgi:hypothetical protein
LLGIASFIAYFGKPLLVVPPAALLFGIFALRSSTGSRRPVGTTPAMIGMTLAIGFGACGVFLPWFKSMTLGAQAEKFSRDYLEVIARGDDYFAIELEKDYYNRFPSTMNLEEHYASSETASRSLQEFKEQSTFETIRSLGPQATWVLDRPVRIYYSYGREHAEVILRDPTGKTDAKIQMFLDYAVDSKGNGQWHVEECGMVSRQYIAPAIL